MLRKSVFIMSSGSVVLVGLCVSHSDPSGYAKAFLDFVFHFLFLIWHFKPSRFLNNFGSSKSSSWTS